TIELDQSISLASRMMKEHKIRHLPVVDEQDVLVGVVSHPEVGFVAALEGLDPDRRSVTEVMTDNPYVVAPEADLQEVAHHLVERKETCAVVVDQGRIVGVFTLIDALRALIDLSAATRRV